MRFKVGEFKSSEVEKLLVIEEGLRMKFAEYCLLQQKQFEANLFMEASGPLKFILKIYIKDGNNGEIEYC